MYKLLTVVKLFLGLIMTLSPFPLMASESNEISNKILEEKLVLADVKYVELEGLGFGIEDFGSHRLNKIAKSLKDKYGVYLVLNTRVDFAKYGVYSPEGSFIAVKADIDMIDGLLEWKPSILRSTLIHEIRHVYLSKLFDEKSKVSPFSTTLLANQADVISELTNAYYKFLSFQEFSTFPLEFRVFSQGIEQYSPEEIDHLFKLITTFHNFAHEALQALEFFEKNILSDKVRFEEIVEKRGEANLKFISVQSERWGLNFQINFEAVGDRTPNNIAMIQKRIARSRQEVKEYYQISADLRNALKSKNGTDFRKVKSLIFNLNQVSRRSMREASGLKCSSLLQ